MFKYFKQGISSTGLLTSTLYDENTFYDRFIRDLKQCQQELIIESPYITTKRLNLLLPALQKLKSERVRISINTRNPEEHNDGFMRSEAQFAISSLQHLAIQVLYTINHHRKLAIIDRHILYEGSLNILSQNNSCEIMRRIESFQLAWETTRFIKIDRFVK